MPASLEVTYYNSYWGKKLPGKALVSYTAVPASWSSDYVPVSGGYNKPDQSLYQSQWYI